jgi:crossover junction endodeoxyribonuclease RuvC
MNILAIDIGTQCGWALGTRDGKVRSGSHSFAPGPKDRRGQRWLKFCAFLTEIAKPAGDIHAVYYEDVKNHAGVLASHVYGGFLGNLERWCEINGIPCYPVGVGQIKKHWTGKGNAKKDAMMEAARARGFVVFDDNHADALAILDLARGIESSAVVLSKKAPKRKAVKLLPAALKEAA